MVDAARGQVAKTVLETLTDGCKRHVNVNNAIKLDLIGQRVCLRESSGVAWLSSDSR